jgi:hypothetical protein
MRNDFKSIRQIVKHLRANENLNEDAYRRLKMHMRWFVYPPLVFGILLCLTIIIKSLVAENFSIKLFIVPAIVFLIHQKVKNHYLQTVKLYTFGEITEGEVLKGSHKIQKLGFIIKLAFKALQERNLGNQSTIFHDHWAGMITQIKVVGYDERAIFESTQGKFARFAKYCELLIGKKLYVLYLPEQLKQQNLWMSIIGLHHSGFTVYASGVADCSCLSKQRYARYLSTIDPRKLEDQQ